MIRWKIGLIGAAECSRAGWSAARHIGSEVARRGGILVCGGLGGVMEAGAKGASEAGGLTVGILPGAADSDANPYISIPIPTGLMQARNVLVVRASHVLIAVEGGFGTLSEIALALNMGKPVVGLRTWPGIPGVHYVNTPEEAVNSAFERLIPHPLSKRPEAGNPPDPHGN